MFFSKKYIVKPGDARHLRPELRAAPLLVPLPGAGLGGDGLRTGPPPLRGRAQQEGGLPCRADGRRGPHGQVDEAVGARRVGEEAALQVRKISQHFFEHV